MIRLYIEQAINEGSSLELDQDQAHYLKTVMRKEIGDKIKVFNAHSGEWVAKIHFIAKKSCTLQIESQTKSPASEPDIWLIFARIKRAATDLIIQKATELGVAKILPTYTEHSEKNPANRERLVSIAREAAEQCERLSIPEICEEEKLFSLLQGWDSGRKILMCDEAGGGKPIKEVLEANKNAKCKWAILIGPEGGFSRGELDNLRKQPYILPIGLGPRILKAETAAIAALACWQEHIGDWQTPPKFESK